MIRKITGSVDRFGDLIRKFKNQDDPRIAVTVDLLTTGIGRLRHDDGTADGHEP